LEEFSDVFEGRALYPFLLYYVPCCFVKEMSLFEAGVMTLYYGNESSRMVFRVFREAIDLFFGLSWEISLL